MFYLRLIYIMWFVAALNCWYMSSVRLFHVELGSAVRMSIFWPGIAGIVWLNVFLSQKFVYIMVFKYFKVTMILLSKSIANNSKFIFLK